jgi:enhancing lycopene biosynthesis protein 2
MLAESARISRGDITPLNRLDASALASLTASFLA